MFHRFELQVLFSWRLWAEIARNSCKKDQSLYMEPRGLRLWFGHPRPKKALCLVRVLLTSTLSPSVVAVLTLNRWANYTKNGMRWKLLIAAVTIFCVWDWDLNIFDKVCLFVCSFTQALLYLRQGLLTESINIPLVSLASETPRVCRRRSLPTPQNVMFPLY